MRIISNRFYFPLIFHCPKGSFGHKATIGDNGFCFAQFLQDKVSLFPFISKVDNKGFNQNATNCPSYCRTKWFFVDSDNKDFIFPKDVRINERVYKDVMYYRSYLIRMKSLLINAYSKMVYRLFSQSNR